VPRDAGTGRRVPSRDTVHEYVERLRQVARQAASVEARLGRAVERERSGTNLPDGWPSGGGGNDDGGRGDDGFQSSTERAAAARLGREYAPDARAPRDRHRELTLAAFDHLRRAVHGAEIAWGVLRALDELLEEGDAEVTVRSCEACTGKRGRGGNRAVAHRGTVGDRLKYALDLCDACYGFVERTAKPGSRGGYLPSEDQVRRHEERGRWRLKA